MVDFGFRLKRFNSKKLKKLIKTSLLFTYFSAHAWNRYRTCVKTFPHMRENFSAHAWKLFRTCVKNFRTCVKTFPHAWNRFRTCVKTFPDLRENFFAYASQLFLTCVKTFPYCGICTCAITYIYQLWTWFAHLGQSYNVIIKEDNKSSTLSLKFIGLISKTA